MRRLWTAWLKFVWTVTGPASVGFDLLRAILRAAVLYLVLVVTLGMASVTVQAHEGYVAVRHRVERVQQSMAEVKERLLRLLPGKREQEPPAPVEQDLPSFGLPDIVWLLFRGLAALLPPVLEYWWAVAGGLAFLSFSHRRARRRFA